MDMKHTFYLIMALLTLSMASVHAQEIEIPEDAPRETWQLVYDDYRSRQYSYIPEYKDLTMDVTVVRGENCLYVQGIAKSCPTSWVKLGRIEDVFNNQLILWNNQPVEVAGETQYLNAGRLIGEFYSGHSFTELTYRCTSGSLPIVFKRNLESDRLEYEATEINGFWLNKEPNKGDSFTEYTIWQINGVQEPFIIEETKFPEAEVYVHPRLIDTTNVPAGINATEDESDAPVYTLSGIKADRNNLTPGIYVSRGKKIVLK